MGSIFDNTLQHRLFLVYGNLGDRFITGDLVSSDFETFLHRYLRDVGYKNAFFYNSAEECIYTRSIEEADRYAGKAPSGEIKETPKKRNRKSAGATLFSTTSEPEKSEEINEEQPVEDEKVPVKFNVDVSELVDRIYPLLKGNNSRQEKNALIISDFQSFIKDLGGNKKLENFFTQLTKVNRHEDAGVCILLYPGGRIVDICHGLQNANMTYLQNYFFENVSMENNNYKGIPKKDVTLWVGAPKQDEIEYLLERLRICGIQGKKALRDAKVNIDPTDISKIADYLVSYANFQDSESKRKIDLRQLSGVEMFINDMSFDLYKETSNIDISAEYVRELCGIEKTESALESLNKPGWESVYKRVKVISNAASKIKKNRLGERIDKTVNSEDENIILCNGRIDMEADGSTGFVSDKRPAIPHFILEGNPGTGKTTIARKMAAVLYEAGFIKTMNVVERNRSTLLGQYIGHTEANFRQAVEEAEEGVLFIDEVYSLLQNDGDTGTNGRDFGHIVLDSLLEITDPSNKDKYHVCVILAGYGGEKMEEVIRYNPGIASRFSKENRLVLPDATPEYLKNAFINNLAAEGFELDPDIKIDDYMNNLYHRRDTATFGNYREVQMLANTVIGEAASRDPEGNIIKYEDFNGSIDLFDNKTSATAEAAIATLDKYVGMEHVKDQIAKIREEIERDMELDAEGMEAIKAPKHFIFSGNPGTGKTTLGKVLGEVLFHVGLLGNPQPYIVSAQTLIGSHSGATGERVNKIIKDAISGNRFLFIDEMSEVVNSPYCEELVAAILNPTGEKGARYRVAFALYPEYVEDFIKKDPGLARRFEIIKLEDYTGEQLHDIFTMQVKKYDCSIDPSTDQRVKEILMRKYATGESSKSNAAMALDLFADMHLTADKSSGRRHLREIDIPRSWL